MKTRPTNPSAVENRLDEFTKAFARKPTRRGTLQMLSGGFLGTVLGLRGPKAWASSTTSNVPTPGGVEDVSPFDSKELSICSNQDYALCAGVICFVYNNVAYCKCNLMSGTSISNTLSWSGGTVCDFNAEGPSNGYVVSTYSVPPGNQSLYFCPPSLNSYYASCDGGVCFTSSRGQSFPGLGQLEEDQVVCACAIKNGAAAVLGHQIFGPNPCDASFFKNCRATGANGTYLYEAAPTGSYEVGAAKLNGAPAHFNMCF
jgi:hypothetical protein